MTATPPLPGQVRPFRRYVAIGDSSTEGLDDPAGDGSYRGWANRLAEILSDALPAAEDGLLYANLGVRGKRTREIRDLQLAPALAMRPDLVTLFAGTNDVVARRPDLGAVAADLDGMLEALRGSGATVLTFTLPDLTPVLPLARRLAPRIRVLNGALRSAAARHGALLVDFAAFPVASDPRLWSPDRLHANALGHARIAAALAHALRLPGTDDAWQRPLAAAPRRSRARFWRDEAAWALRYLLPWAARHLAGRSSGDRRAPKRPELSPFFTDRRPR